MRQTSEGHTAPASRTRRANLVRWSWRPKRHSQSDEVPAPSHRKRDAPSEADTHEADQEGRKPGAETCRRPKVHDLPKVSWLTCRHTRRLQGQKAAEFAAAEAGGGGATPQTRTTGKGRGERRSAQAEASRQTGRTRGRRRRGRTQRGGATPTRRPTTARRRRDDDDDQRRRRRRRRRQGPTPPAIPHSRAVPSRESGTTWPTLVAVPRCRTRN